MDDVSFGYYVLRIGLGVIGALLWLAVMVRAYRAMETETIYERRLWTILLVSFPAIYSIGYALITFYGLWHLAPPPDLFPIVIATGVQAIAIVYAVRLLRRTDR